MATNLCKIINNPHHISILFPTKNRPHYLQNLFDSIEITTEDKSLVDVWVYIDDDDTLTLTYMESELIQKYNFAINYVIGKTTKSQGEMNNILRERCTTNPGIYMIGGDKVVFLTPSWDKLVRDLFSQYPDRILFAYPVDTHHGESFGAYGFISAEWTNITGRFLTEYFPYWFDDVWINDVSTMINRKFKLDVLLGLQGGKGSTARLRNLLFWQRFYNNTLSERIEEAEKFREVIYPNKGLDYLQNLAKGQEVIRVLNKNIQLSLEKNLIYLELQCASQSTLNSNPNADYLLLERAAVTQLQIYLLISISQGNIFKAAKIFLNILSSYHYLKEYEYKRVLFMENFRWVFRLCHLSI